MMRVKLFFIWSVLSSSSFFNTDAQTFSLSNEESSITFIIKNFGLNVEGSISGLQGTIRFDPLNIQKSLFDVKVESNSVDTGIELRDKHLKKKEFLDIEHHPYIHFISTKVSYTDKNNIYQVTGKLTIKGVTKEVQFNFTVDVMKNNIELKGGFEINRRDYNVGGNSLSMRDTLNIKLHVIAQELPE